MKSIKDCSETIPVKVLKTAKLLENFMDVSVTKLQNNILSEPILMKKMAH